MWFSNTFYSMENYISKLGGGLRFIRTLPHRDFVDILSLEIIMVESEENAVSWVVISISISAQTKFQVVSLTMEPYINTTMNPSTKNT